MMQQTAQLKISRISGPVSEALAISDPSLFEASNHANDNIIVGKLRRKMPSAVSVGKMTSGTTTKNYELFASYDYHATCT